MTNQILACGNCGLKFTQSLINDRALADFFLPFKPDAMPARSELECPNCGTTATYQRSDLTYKSY
jgi:predicted RNA-binding Zn-ribbon protein involved in translation (DUF1610 family)